MAKVSTRFSESSRLKSVVIVKNGIEFEIYPWKNKKGTSSLRLLNIHESIHSTLMGGYIELKDHYDWSGELNVHSFEKLIVSFYTKFPKVPFLLDTKTIEFNIISVSQISDKPSNYTVDGKQEYNVIRIDFTTDDPLITLDEEDILNFEGDFVGYISLDPEKAEESEIKGLVNEIFNKLQIEEYEIEPTFNGIWIKSNEIAYPWSKSKGQLDLETLFNYIKNYAVSQKNPNAVNFFLWRDTEGYHFRSVEGLIDDQKDVENEKIYFLREPTIENAVRQVLGMNEADVLQLATNNTFQSYYEKISPNYDDYYLDFIDTSLAFKTEIVDFDYHRDFGLWSSLNEYKIIPDSQETSILSKTKNKPIQTLKTDDEIYGYYTEGKLNTPYYQWWDYIGASANSKWNNVNYIPQYDMTELDLPTFHTIHKKIREPLKEKRSKFSYLKNLKRKWEVYRCSVCCLADRFGGIKDQQDIERFQSIRNPGNDPEFKILFGPTGVFGDLGQEYRIGAAGSFTDVYNYDPDVIENKGITLSYNLNSAPYNQTIKQFYNFADTFDNYEKHIFENGFKTYDLLIEKNNKTIADLNEFINSSNGYISLNVNYHTSILYEIEVGANNPPDFPLNIPNTTHGVPMNPPFRFGFNTDIHPCGYNSYPSWVALCSKIKFNVYSVQATGGRVFFRSPYDFYRYTNHLENPIVNFLESKNATEKLSQALDASTQDGCTTIWCTDCLSANTLIVKRRKAFKIRATLLEQNKLITHLRDTLRSKFYEKWKLAKEEYLNRKAFFISKREDKIDNAKNIVNSNSLYNIKSIKRKSIRGSRYEILARNKGITGAEIGPYLYQIFFDDDSDRELIPGLFNHPYYDKKYKTNIGTSSYKSESDDKTLGLIDDIIPENDPPFTGVYDPIVGYDYSGSDEVNSELLGGVSEPNKLKGFISVSDKARRSNYTDTAIKSDFIQRSLELTNNTSGYDERYNLYHENLTNLKPPSIIREEISSYVRIEFKEPIGLESIVDFPNGFVRNAGYEYFLPYLVSLTSGPNGRQTINQNIVVIGMDPYGFDVAMKRIPDVKQNGEYYWWWSGIESPQMDLWPEVAFETEYNYYSCHKESDVSVGAKYNSSLDGSPLRFSIEFDYKSQDDYKDFAKQTVNENFTIYGSMDEALKNNKKASDYSQTLDNLNYASNYLLDVNKSLKAFRNWWSFHIPSNIITVPYFDSAIFDPDASSPYSKLNQGISVITNNTTSMPSEISYNTQYNSYLYSNKNYLRNISSLRSDINRFKSYEEVDTNNFYENYIDLDYSYQDSAEIITNMEAQGVVYIIPNSYYEEKISVFKSNDIFRELHPDIKAYFGRITNWWLSGDHIIYRPGLMSQDVWKYDLSGYSEYGMIFPPTTKNHPDIFDNNFAGQFVVFTRSTNFCDRLDFKCLNPKAPVTTAGCTAGDPYCNCPARNRQPNEPEPSYIELYKAEQEIKECVLIEENLGPEWLGCVWSDSENTASCNCPEIGDRFMDYLEY